MSARATIERAFELANSGECRTPAEIRQQLKREHFEAVELALCGKSIRRQLSQLCSEAAFRKSGIQPSPRISRPSDKRGGFTAWSGLEVERLQALQAEGLSCGEVARAIGRSEEGTRGYARKLGLTFARKTRQQVST